jgi:hypothetical protein
VKLLDERPSESVGLASVPVATYIAIILTELLKWSEKLGIAVAGLLVWLAVTVTTALKARSLRNG